MARIKVILVLLVVMNCNGNERQAESLEQTVFGEYFENGSLKYEFELRDSIQHGAYKEYYLNGQIKSKGRYANGKLEGVVLCYYPSGEIQCVESYSNDLLNGESIYYHENGNIDYKGKFYNGKKVGLHYEYFEEKNGVIKSRTEYVIVRSKNLVNTKTVYDNEGKVVKQGTRFEAKVSNNALTIEVSEKEFDDVAVVVCDYDMLFNLRHSYSCDTVYSDNKTSVAIP